MWERRLCPSRFPCCSTVADPGKSLASTCGSAAAETTAERPAASTKSRPSPPCTSCGMRTTWLLQTCRARSELLLSIYGSLHTWGMTTTPQGPFDENAVFLFHAQIKLWDVRVAKPVQEYKGHHNEHAYLPVHVCEDEGLLLAGRKERVVLSLLTKGKLPPFEPSVWRFASFFICSQPVRIATHGYGASKTAACSGPSPHPTPPPTTWSRASSSPPSWGAKRVCPACSWPSNTTSTISPTTPTTRTSRRSSKVFRGKRLKTIFFRQSFDWFCQLKVPVSLTKFRQSNFWRKQL